MCVRITDADDPWNGPELPVGQAGMLLDARAERHAFGYLGQPQKTAEVLRDGWYCTGDVAMMDEDGFLEIARALEPLQQDRRRDGAAPEDPGKLCTNSPAPRER